jgi:predicted transcriptional regulator
MRILLSIKPVYAIKIFNGEKKYEFRRKIFKREGIHTVLVYVSQPVGKVIGEFYIEDIVSDTVDQLWNSTREYAGISECAFYQYFKGISVGYAMKIGGSKKYSAPFNIQDRWNISPPQSFLYLE